MPILNLSRKSFLTITASTIIILIVFLVFEIITNVITAIIFILVASFAFILALKKYHLKWSIKRNVTIGFIFGMALMSFMSVVAHFTIENLLESSRMVAHTREVEYNISKLSSLLLNLDLDRQNYLLTGKKIYRENSFSTLNEINSKVSLFGKLTVDNPNQQSRARLINSLIRERTDLLQRTYDQFESQGSIVNSSILFLRQRTVILNKISDLLADAELEEKRLLAVREEQTSESSQFTFFIIPLGDFISIAILVWIFMLLNSEVSTRLKSEAALKESEEKLKLSVKDLKQKEEELSRLNENLNTSNQELAQFAYVASHDLQEPLRMVASFTQLLEKRYKDKLDSDANEFISFAVDGANRMQRLINDLLEYSRVSTRGKEFSEIELSTSLGTALSNLQNRIQESGAMIVSDDLPSVKGDQTQLMRVFQNLIENAIKFRGKESPRIFIKSRTQKDKVIISVQDNGIGIDNKYRDRIFVIFQRLHSASVYPGTGIGLTICKKIIERHGGKIWLESEPGKGTTFYFSLTK